MITVLLAVTYKEFVQVFRNPQALRRLLTLQSMTFIMMAWININVRDAPTVVVDQDRTSESRLLIDRLTATHAFRIAYVTSSTAQAREHIKGGRAKVAIVIPPDFGRLRAAGGTAEVLALVDGSESNSSSQAINALNGAVARMNLEAQQEVVDEVALLTPHSVLLFNPQGRTANFMLPGMLAIMLGLGYGGMAMRRLVAERTGGNLERLLMTPMSHTGLILGKAVPFFLLGTINAAVYLTIIRWGFNVPIRGSLALLVFALMLYVITVLSLGSLVAADAKNMGQANASWALINFPAFMLSGYVFPVSSLPKVLLPISFALPHTHFIAISRGICLRGASLEELAPDLMYLIVAPILFSVVAGARFKRSILG